MSGKDRIAVLKKVELIVAGASESLDRKKLKGYEYLYRVRVGNYRIIYYDDGKEIDLKAIKKRDESTYSDF